MMEDTRTPEEQTIDALVENLRRFEVVLSRAHEYITVVQDTMIEEGSEMHNQGQTILTLIEGLSEFVKSDEEE